MRKTIALLAILGAGCTTMAAEDPGSGEITGSCRAEGLESFVGQPATAENGSEILNKSGAKKLRWIPYGAAVTMDYSPDRVNVKLDPQNRIEGITCG
jgi:hypothetical protein